jgi:hypothetical protein
MKALAVPKLIKTATPAAMTSASIQTKSPAGEQPPFG